MARELSVEALARLDALPDGQVACLLAIVQARRAWAGRAELGRHGHGEALIELMATEIVDRPWAAAADGTPLTVDSVTLTPYGAWLCGVAVVEMAEECPSWGAVHHDEGGGRHTDEPDCVRLPGWYLGDGRTRLVGMPGLERVADPRAAREVEYVEDEHTGEALVLMGVKVERSRRIKPPRRAG